MAENESFSTEVKLNVPSDVKPFQNVCLKMNVKADLSSQVKTENDASLEHRVSKSILVKIREKDSIMYAI